MINPHISIIICTRNRADSLREALVSIACCQVPTDLASELLVVDNGSSDHTRDVIKNAELKNMLVRYIHEPRTGQCYARNRGLAEARGEVILFTDDDVRVPRDWIEDMCRPIIQRRADAVAGGVRLAQHLERPWLKGFLRMFVACTGWSSSNTNVQLVGANMAFSREVLKLVPAFDPELGPGALGFGDETLFSLQIVRAAFRLVHNWETTVEHHFDGDRLTKEAFLQIAECIGRSKAYIEYHWEHRDLIAPRLRELWIVAKLKVRRVVSLTASNRGEPKPWEVSYTYRIRFFDQYRKERQRRRNYERFGLVKVHGVLDHANRVGFGPYTRVGRGE